MSCGCGVSSNPYWLGAGTWRCGRCGEDCLAVRPQGPDGPAGPDGITPSFEVGTVEAGNAPAVTIEAVSPTLYRLNFILPETYTLGDNTWTGTNTFLGDVVVSGSVLAATGGLTTAFLVVTNGALFNGAVVGGALTLTDTSTLSVAGTSTFVGDVTITGPVTISGDITLLGNFTVSGDVTFNLTAEGAGHSRGSLVVDECGNLKYLQGTGSRTPTIVTDNTPATLLPGQPETQVGTTITVNIPAFACAQTDEVQYVTIFARLQISSTTLSTGFFAFNLWADAIGGGGTLLDTFEAGGGSQMALLEALNVEITPGVARDFFLSAADGSTPPSLSCDYFASKTWVT